jgi:hypothetical protein
MNCNLNFTKKLLNNLYCLTVGMHPDEMIRL